jgi:hypothetical protein
MPQFQVHGTIIHRPHRALFLSGVLAVVIGCGKGEGASIETMVFIDTVTKKPVVQPASLEFPAVNLATGKRTLKPAAYCDACLMWHAIPPLDQIQRSPDSLICPKSKTALRFDGPKPSAGP